QVQESEFRGDGGSRRRARDPPRGSGRCRARHGRGARARRTGSGRRGREPHGASHSAQHHGRDGQGFHALHAQGRDGRPRRRSDRSRQGEPLGVIEGERSARRRAVTSDWDAYRAANNRNRNDAETQEAEKCCERSSSTRDPTTHRMCSKARSMKAIAPTWLPSISRKTPAHSSYDWHPDPEPQFVITLSGTLEFATPDGDTFILRPGDVLVAVDHIGKGHKWRLIDDQPWRRAYVVLKPGAKDSFVAKGGR